MGGGMRKWSKVILEGKYKKGRLVSNREGAMGAASHPPTQLLIKLFGQAKLTHQRSRGEDAGLLCVSFVVIVTESLQQLKINFSQVTYGF